MCWLDVDGAVLGLIGYRGTEGLRFARVGVIGVW